jgi:hypothetical protein
VNIKIAGKWMFITLKMVLIGIDPIAISSCRSPTCRQFLLLHGQLLDQRLQLRPQTLPFALTPGTNWDEGRDETKGWRWSRGVPMLMYLT